MNMYDEKAEESCVRGEAEPIGMGRENRGK